MFTPAVIAITRLKLQLQLFFDSFFRHHFEHLQNNHDETARRYRDGSTSCAPHCRRLSTSK